MKTRPLKILFASLLLPALVGALAPAMAQNLSRTHQEGWSNRADTSQRGSGNVASTFQGGRGNAAQITQEGRNNFAGIAQLGDAFDKTIDQSGNNRSNTSFQVDTDGRRTANRGSTVGLSHTSTSVEFMAK